MTHSIYLSHPLNAKTPAYKGGEGLIVKREKSISCGDTCNQLHVTMSNHLGTHVDAPIVPLLEEHYPNLKAIGLDVISVTSLLDRDQGRKIHQALLGQGIRIFEDVALGHIKRELKEVIALPLMLEAADGAPVTMIGML